MVSKSPYTTKNKKTQKQKSYPTFVPKDISSHGFKSPYAQKKKRENQAPSIIPWQVNPPILQKQKNIEKSSSKYHPMASKSPYTTKTKKTWKNQAPSIIPWQVNPPILQKQKKHGKIKLQVSSHGK